MGLIRIEKGSVRNSSLVTLKSVDGVVKPTGLVDLDPDGMGWMLVERYLVEGRRLGLLLHTPFPNVGGVDTSLRSRSRSRGGGTLALKPALPSPPPLTPAIKLFFILLFRTQDEADVTVDATLNILGLAGVIGELAPNAIFSGGYLEIIRQLPHFPLNPRLHLLFRSLFFPPEAKGLHAFLALLPLAAIPPSSARIPTPKTLDNPRSCSCSSLARTPKSSSLIRCNKVGRFDTERRHQVAAAGEFRALCLEVGVYTVMIGGSRGRCDGMIEGCGISELGVRVQELVQGG
ncbi:hypothetical protein V5O48_011463 [Marasmius crinis-equi]|uniref:Uncharacterized protein n=1 Tax=Marasmius crinis-equi TaxID=585013 RepID=A0ABR3F5L5_9AGAR